MTTSRPALALVLRPPSGALGALAVALFFAGGCSRAPASRARDGRFALVTLAPMADPAPASAPGLRLPDGARLVRVDLEHPDAPVRPLSDGLAAAGSARLSHDGTRVVFVGRRAEGDPESLWTCAPDGSGRRLLVGGDKPCGPGAFLPDGRVVYAAPVGATPGHPRSPASCELHVADGDGTPGHRITFRGGVARDPAVLGDGRIVFVDEPAAGVGERAAGGPSLLTVHPDGTGVSLLHGPASGGAAFAQPRPARDGTLVLLTSDGSHAGGLRLLDRRDPWAAGTDASPADLDLWCAEPAADGGILAGAAPRDAAGSALHRLDRGGRSLGPAWRPPDGWRIVDVAEVAGRARPQGHLSSVDLERTHGLLLGLDARWPGGEGAVRARIRAASADAPMEPGAPRAVLGEVALEADGSFFVRVPSDTPLFIDLVGDDGAVLVASRSPFWVRPGEQRACIGCHEAPDVAPPNRRPMATLRAPVDLTGSTVARMTP